MIRFVLEVFSAFVRKAGGRGGGVSLKV